MQGGLPWSNGAGYVPYHFPLFHRSSDFHRRPPGEQIARTPSLAVVQFYLKARRLSGQRREGACRYQPPGEDGVDRRSGRGG